MDHLIDVTEANPVEIIKAAYDLSSPQGMGYLHYTPEPLTDEEAQKLLDGYPQCSNILIDLDYVNGRALKFVIFKKDDRLYIKRDWFDHTPHHVTALLTRIGVIE